MDAELRAKVHPERATARLPMILNLQAEHHRRRYSLGAMNAELNHTWGGVDIGVNHLMKHRGALDSLLNLYGIPPR